MKGINIFHLLNVVNSTEWWLPYFQLMWYFARGKAVKAHVDLNFVTLQHFGTGQSLKLSLSECLKVRCGVWLICLCDLAFLGFLSELFSEISGLWRHVEPTFCPAESAVPVLVIAWGRMREMRSRCPVSDWDQNPAIKRQALPEISFAPKYWG